MVEFAKGPLLVDTPVERGTSTAVPVDPPAVGPAVDSGSLVVEFAKGGTTTDVVEAELSTPVPVGAVPAAVGSAIVVLSTTVELAKGATGIDDEVVPGTSTAVPMGAVPTGVVSIAGSELEVVLGNNGWADEVVITVVAGSVLQWSSCQDDGLRRCGISHDHCCLLGRRALSDACTTWSCVAGLLNNGPCGILERRRDSGDSRSRSGASGRISCLDNNRLDSNSRCCHLRGCVSRLNNHWLDGDSGGCHAGALFTACGHNDWLDCDSGGCHAGSLFTACGHDDRLNRLNDGSLWCGFRRAASSRHHHRLDRLGNSGLLSTARALGLGCGHYRLDRLDDGGL